MSKRRQERMSIEIQKIMARIIQEQIKDPRIDSTSLSVTRVDVSNDLSHARVYVSVLGDNDKQDETMHALHKAKGFIRTQLVQDLQVRHAPELEFRLDRSIEHGIRIAALLDEIKEEHKGEK
ncbi:MAG: 30S ribosome-binding factor RbfA [Syntrophomonadaceae bacterium]|nr:30S ribosome-binding factor RbfA [Syntrophomonadaceae bacterium]